MKNLLISQCRDVCFYTINTDLHSEDNGTVKHNTSRKYSRPDSACFKCDELDFQLMKHSIWPAVSTQVQVKRNNH